MGEVRQMMPPYILDGKNTAEILISNMDYAQVSAAVITQEYIDGLQNQYLTGVQQKVSRSSFCCGMFDARQPGYYSHAEELVKQGFVRLRFRQTAW